ncbi:MAG: hypothetical protein M1835_001296 [Candelina submexicana]|nr:MAG: hypothetical protein M1835_001296 [Candelina submexicana]
MFAEQSFSNADLRSAAVDYNRFHADKAKWAHGEAAYAPGRRNDIAEGTVRPVHPQQKVNAAIRRGVGADLARADHRNKMARKFEVLEEVYSPSDLSAEEDVDNEATTAPEPDADITYSFDAPRGPRKGSQILSLALAKAVETFEVKETDRIVKEEYEVLDENGEPVKRGRATKKTKPEADYDDFELV